MMKVVGLLFGMAFGFLLAAAGFNDYTVIHEMLLLRDPEPYLVMGSAVGVAMPLLWLMERRGWRTPMGGRLVLSRARVERHHLTGGAMFGTGWAIAGTCPAPALAMVSSGALLGLPVIAGLFAGLALRDAVAARRRGAAPVATAPTPATADPVVTL